MSKNPLTALLVTVGLVFTVALAAAQGPKPPQQKDVAVTSIIAAGYDITNDGNPSYPNSRTLKSLIQAIGDWELDAINPRNATRLISLDFSDPVAGSGPGGTNPGPGPSGVYPFRILMQCAYNVSMHSLRPGDVIECPLRIAFDGPSGVRYVIFMNKNFPTLNGPFPTTDNVTVTCTAGSSSTCSTWAVAPYNSQPQNSGKLVETDGSGNIVADHGDYYFSFSFTLQK